MGKLDGKIALVTGASKGIGRGIALAYAREGAEVAGTFHPSESHPDEVQAAIEAIGRRALFLPCEVAEEAQVGATVRGILHAFGRIDVLVTNAGYAEETPVAEMTASMPLGRFPAPADVANAVLFLASPASAFVTGHTLPVDSGFLAR